MNKDYDKPCLVANPRFKLAQRVCRPIDCYAPLHKWVFKHGKVTRIYASVSHLRDSPPIEYDELYEVLWDDGTVGEAFLPHGLDESE